MYSSYPNIFKFIEVLLNVQTGIYIQMRSLNLTNEIRMDVKKDDFIKNIL